MTRASQLVKFEVLGRHTGDPRKEALKTSRAVPPSSAEGIQTGLWGPPGSLLSRMGSALMEPEKLHSRHTRARMGLAGEAEPLFAQGEWDPRISGGC